MKGIPREVRGLKQKRVTNSASLRLQRKNLALSSQQEEILIGALLGDGSLSRDGWSRNYRLQLVQGDDQKEYLLWKMQSLQNCFASAPSYQTKNHSWRARTLSHPVFNRYAEWFYCGKRKIVPPLIADHLTPLSLAIWFMDDGARGPRADGYILNTQSFTYEENQHLADCLQEKFGLTMISIHHDRKWWRLYIRRGSMDNFTKLIAPHIIPSMQYKL